MNAVWGGSGEGSRIYSESDWTDTDDPNQSPYSLSKTFAEQAAWEFVKKHGAPELTVINPSFVLGPALEKDYGASLELIYKFFSDRHLFFTASPLHPQDRNHQYQSSKTTGDTRDDQ